MADACAGCCLRGVKRPPPACACVLSASVNRTWAGFERGPLQLARVADGPRGRFGEKSREGEGEREGCEM